MNKIKIIALISILCLLCIVPTTYALDNSTILSAGDDDNLANEYYFDANIENDTGNGTKYNPYKILNQDRIEYDSIIHLASGKYNLNESISLDNVQIIGENPQKTIINYTSKVFSAYDNVCLANLTLVSPKISNFGNLTATNVIFDSSYRDNGGAIYSSQSGVTHVTLINCTFSNNHAQFGGAVYISNCVLDITDSLFINNYAEMYGGAIAVDSKSNVTLKKTRFINDYSLNDAGGALFIIGSDNFIGRDLQMTNCSARFGGAICSLNAYVNLTNVTAKNNRAVYDGGAIYAMYKTLSIYNSTFDGNSALNGGSLYIDAVEIFNIYSNHFTNNHATRVGGAIFSVLSEAFYDSILDKKLNNSFKGNSAAFENDVYESQTVNLTIGNGDYILMKYNSSYNGSLPSSYDLRQLGYVTPVKNQGQNGNCWAFASLAALESSILKATGISYDLSEENMKNLMALYSDYGWAMDPNKGGYDKMAVGYLTGWLGPVFEENDTYYINGVLSPLLNSFMHVQNIVYFTRTNYTDNDAIKKAIMDYGAVSTSIYWSNSNLRSYNYYYSGSSGANHAVAIVGWDDNYSKSNFRNTPEGDGAWIIKNSWGTTSGNNGYFYVSYYDTRLAPLNKPESTFAFVLNDTVKFDKSYQYDIPGLTDYFLNTTDTVWYKNKFTATGNEYLAAVSTYFKKQSSWDLSVYVNDVLKLTQSGKSPVSYSTIDLNELIPLKKGDIFEIMFKVSVDGDVGVPISESISLNNELYSENMSFISYDGENWTDLYGLLWVYPDHSYMSQVACIKAFTILDELVPSIEFDIDNFNPVIITATVKDQYGNPVKSGKITFNVEGEEISSNVADGVSRITYVYKKLGNNTITAKYTNVGYKDAFASITENIYPDDINIRLNITTDVVNAQIDVELSKNVNETLYLKINNDNYSIEMTNGKGTLHLADLYYGVYDVVGYMMVDTYYCENASQSFTIDYLNTFIEADDFDIYLNKDFRYSIRLVDKYNNPISDKNVIFSVNNLNYTSKTDDSGIAYLDYQFACGQYGIFVLSQNEGKYLSSYAVFNGNVKSTISLPAGNVYTYNSKYVATLKDSNGNLLKNKDVSVTIGSKTYSYQTDSNGKLSFDVVQSPGTYNVAVKNPLTYEELSQSIKVVKRITSNKDLTAYYGAGKSYTVRVFDDNGNVAKKVKVTFKVNGKTYSRYTDSNGYASLKIGLNPKTYTITATYKGYTVKNKVVVKTTLITKNVSVKKGKTLKFTVKLLNSNGKIIKNKKVTIKFKGKTYKAKTNGMGIATLKVKCNYKAGKYTITSSYGSLKISNKITIKK